MQLRGSRRARCDTKKPLNYKLGFIAQDGTAASVLGGLYYAYDVFGGKIRFRKVDWNGAFGSSGYLVECYWNGSIWFFSNNSGTVAAGVFGASAVDFPWQVGGYTTSLIVTRKDRLFY